MIEFIIKSTISLAFLYVFYILLLGNARIFRFNRFYLLFSLVFSVAVPFVHIETGFHAPINQNIQDLSSATNGLIIQGNITGGQGNQILTVTNMILCSYLVITLILLARFVRNLRAIVKKIRNSEKAGDSSGRIVLVPEKNLPYSFFRHIIVNKEDFEKGRINNELIFHEQAHCGQYHSADILFIESMKVLLWFNPLLPAFKREIQLNHEYMADNEVISAYDRDTYQHIVLDLVSRDVTAGLTSNFNCSLTKKRMIMMTKNNSPMTSVVRKIAIVPLVSLLACMLSFSQENLQKEGGMNIEEEWWVPVLEKHNIEPKAFNNFENVFEMGSSNSINNGVVTLKDAFFVIRSDGGEYTFLRSPLAYHYLDANIIEGEYGTLEAYNSKNESLEPDTYLKLSHFRIRIGDHHKNSFEAEKLELNR
jgi:beta-lactamase regulating signal transducer with metallopeptidase domain